MPYRSMGHRSKKRFAVGTCSTNIGSSAPRARVLAELPAGWLMFDCITLKNTLSKLYRLKIVGCVCVSERERKCV